MSGTSIGKNLFIWDKTDKILYNNTLFCSFFFFNVKILLNE